MKLFNRYAHSALPNQDDWMVRGLQDWRIGRMGSIKGSDLIYKLWFWGKVELLILSQIPRGYEGLKRFRSFQKPVWGLRDLWCTHRGGDGMEWNRMACSINVHQWWSMLNNVDQCWTTLINVGQCWRCWSMSMSGDQCWSVLINVDQCWPLAINIDQCWLVLINADQYNVAQNSKITGKS